jgi:hypothetical protein
MEAVNPLVRYFDGNRLEEGFIIRWSSLSTQNFISAITGQMMWTTDCIHNNLTAGTLVSVKPGGRGITEMVYLKGGPFVYMRPAWLD